MSQSAAATTVERVVEVVNRQGLHTRPLAKMMDVANRFKCELRVCKDNVCADPRSVIDMILLAAPQGSKLTITATGEDAPQAVDALATLIADKFNED